VQRLFIYDRSKPDLVGDFMSFFSLKNILIVATLLLLLIGIPVGVYLVQQQQQTQSQAEQSSILSFTPESSEAEPIQVAVGEEVKLDITVNPGANTVSVVAFEVNYDPTILAPSETTPFEANTEAFPVVMDPPVYEEGIIRGRVSTQNVQTGVSVPTKVATITFDAVGETSIPSVISYGAPFTQILSVGGQDEAGENVLSSTTPAYIITTLDSAEPTATPSAIPTVSVRPTTPPGTNPPPQQPPAGGSANASPVCTGLTANGALSGVVPFAVSLSATGNDPDGTVQKMTFNFGDGQTQDVSLDSDGAASGSANTANASHTYNSPGTYRATAVATDNAGGVSAQNECALTITATAPASPTPMPGEPTATIEPTGPTETFIGIGIVAGILTFLGGLLFFTL
jgi:hypothetical protein